MTKAPLGQATVGAAHKACGVVVSLVYIERIILIHEYLFTIKIDRKAREETPAHLQVDRETNSWTRKSEWGQNSTPKRVQSKNERLT